MLGGLLAAQSDQRLVELVEQGNERAFEAIVKRYRRPLMRYCSRIGLAHGQSEDVLQQALMHAWLAIDRGAVVRDLRPWLYRIVHNFAVNSMRRTPDADTFAAAPPHLALADPELGRGLAMRKTLGDLAALPRLQREAILLSAVDGRSYDEVAGALGISEGAVRGLLYRARATLRAAAAALTPAPLVNWVCSSMARSASPGAAGVPQLSLAGGTAGLGGALVKSAAVAITAAVVVAGSGVIRAHRHPARALAGIGAPSDRVEPVGPTRPRAAARTRGTTPVRRAAGALPAQGTGAARGAPQLTASVGHRLPPRPLSSQPRGAAPPSGPASPQPSTGPSTAAGAAAAPAPGSSSGAPAPTPGTITTGERGTTTGGGTTGEGGTTTGGEHGTTGAEHDADGAEDDKKDGPGEEAKCPSEPVAPGTKCSPETPAEEPADH